MSTWQLLAADAARTILAVLSGWSLSLSLRHNAVGSWKVTLPVEAAPKGWPTQGCRLLCVRDGQVMTPGVWDEAPLGWSAEPDGEGSGPGRYELSGDTDLGRVGYHVCYPNPGREWARQDQATHYTHPDQPQPAETVLRRLIDYQCGSNALPARRVAGLRAGLGAGLGEPATVAERFTGLLDACRRIAAAGGGLAFDVRDDLAGGLELVVWQPRDLTATAVFGPGLGNVTELRVQQTAPTGTVALIAGQGSGKERALVELADEHADPVWGRREVFVDQRQTADEDEYLKAGREALGEAAATYAVSATIIDTPRLRFGHDYGLGDKVTVQPPVPGLAPLTDLVTEVKIEVADTGEEQVTSTIGAADPTAGGAVGGDPLIGDLTRLRARVSQLERSL